MLSLHHTRGQLRRAGDHDHRRRERTRSMAAIQKAYGDWGGAQCGFCTPGFIMTVKHLLAVNPEPTDEEIRSALSGNLCRCPATTRCTRPIKAAIVAEQKGVESLSSPVR
jgi:carbon-monoxide dehydrogenase small subunit